MPLETVKFTPNDLAKYPFLKETADYIRLLGLQTEELTSSQIRRFLIAQKILTSNL